MGKINQGLYSSNSDLWETPGDLFNSLDAEFDFSLDACALPENAKCELFFSPQDDGLKQCWRGHRVFCNPPYSDIKRWVKKCYDESRCSDTLVVMLIPARTDTSYFHDYIYNKAEIRFLRGRLHFSGSKNSAPFPSMIVIFK